MFRYNRPTANQGSYVNVSYQKVSSLPQSYFGTVDADSDTIVDMFTSYTAQLRFSFGSGEWREGADTQLHFLVMIDFINSVLFMLNLKTLDQHSLEQESSTSWQLNPNFGPVSYLRKLKKSAKMGPGDGSHTMSPQKRLSCWRRRDCRPTWSPSVAWIVLLSFGMLCSNWRMLERYGL